MLVEKKLSKSALARSLGVSRSSLYYKPKQPAKDSLLRDLILITLTEHPAYGHRRIALDLGTGKNRVNRVMVKFGIKPRISRKRSRYGRKMSVMSGIPNRTQGISPIAPNVIWVGDFTELNFHGKRVFLATVIDRFTREVISWQIGMHHTTQLILDVLEEALRRRETHPYNFHSDQGSEYTAHACVEWIVKNKILPSHSPKGRPWKNGHQESFYGKFKLEFENPAQYKTIELFIEAIARQIYYYNTRRIHSSLKMPPRVFYEKEMERLKPKPESEQEGV
jgi:transposase InsO family protein